MKPQNLKIYYGMTLAIRDHTVLPASQVDTPALTPARQAGTRFMYSRGMEGWVDFGDR